MNPHATHAQSNEQSQGTPMKFTYASGSRPLDGYTIKRGVGRGGFGEVYFAVSDAGKEVALKLIRRHLEVELRGVGQCLNLKHPNLLTLHDIRVDDADDRWVVMEYISGESLEQVIERNPNGLPPEQALFWIRGIAAGVAHLHDHGIVHRDLKPGNIFLDEGVVKIGDYGLSKFVSCSRRSGQTESVGTVHYMAPEIANGRYGKEIDTYALGILFYEVLTGNVPFDGESVGEVLMKHLTAQPKLDMLAEPYRGIAERALSKDPEKRFRNAQQFLDALPGSTPVDSRAERVAPDVTANGAAHKTDSAAPLGTETILDAEVVEEDGEPIWRAIRTSCRQMNDEWTNASIHPAIKFCIVVICVIMFFSFSGILFPIIFLSVVTYGVYRVIRSLVISGQSDSRLSSAQGNKTQATQNASSSADPYSATRDTHQYGVEAVFVDQEKVQPTVRRKKKHRRSHRWRSEQNFQLASKPFRVRIMDLTGSILTSTLIATALAVVMLVLRRSDVRIEQFVWLAAVGSLGAWAVLIPAKLWEGHDIEKSLRRFTMLVMGLLLGAAAWGFSQFLSVDLPYDLQTSMRSPLHEQMPEGFYGVSGAPGLLAYLAYFGFLMLICRWWLQANPTRATRFSLWSFLACLIAAWGLSFFWPFPQPWGVMVVAIISIAVQLASPWLRPARNGLN